MEQYIKAEAKKKCIKKIESLKGFFVLMNLFAHYHKGHTHTGFSLLWQLGVMVDVVGAGEYMYF